MIIRDLTIEQYANRQLSNRNSVRKVTPLKKVEKTKMMELENHFEGNKEFGNVYNKKA